MPRVLLLDPLRPDPIGIAEAARALRDGALVAFPTETVYGLGARALDERALGRVFAAKGRPAHHPLIAHVEGEEQARALAASWPERASLLARAFWPGPLTLVVDRAAHVPAALAAGGDSIAVRAPAHAVALALIASLGEPVAAPSANRYQGLSPTTAAHVVKQLGDRVDLVLDGGACSAGIESTVVDVRGPSTHVLRPGALSLAALRGVLADILVLPGSGPAPSEARPSPGMDARHYAPRARLVLAGTLDEAVQLASSLAGAAPHDGPRSVAGLLVHGASAAIAAGPRVLVHALPADAPGYARRLYGALHAMDDAGVQSIVVQAVPEGDAWWAVADRLKRAAAE
jgi:L-threonylcarbamoyladenylate synthase